jgi:hypothetical protein
MPISIIGGNRDELFGFAEEWAQAEMNARTTGQTASACSIWEMSLQNQ